MSDTDSEGSVELSQEVQHQITKRNPDPSTANGIDSQPYLGIVEQPQSRGFRFRYKCEGSSHGGLQGVNSRKDRKSFPAVKIYNYQGPAQITVTLVTAEKVPRRHAHKLIGKNCKNGICTVELRGDNMTVTFPNLGIQHVTKKNVVETLTERIIEELRIQKKMNYGISESPLTDEEKNNARQQATEEAKNTQLNVVRLCFQAYLRDDNGFYTRTLDSIISKAIYDCKSPGAAALKICRMDKHAGCCTGDDEVFLLCDKVQKDDISVRFFSLDNSEDTIWEAYGTFGPSDVHRQYAIVFKTPKYLDVNIQSPIGVKVQLQRQTDGETSESKPFTYYPQQHDCEEVKKKKRKKIFPDFSHPGLYHGEYSNGSTSPMLTDAKQVSFPGLFMPPPDDSTDGFVQPMYTVAPGGAADGVNGSLNAIDSNASESHNYNSYDESQIPVGVTDLETDSCPAVLSSAMEEDDDEIYADDIETDDIGADIKPYSDIGNLETDATPFHVMASENIPSIRGKRSGHVARSLTSSDKPVQSHIGPKSYSQTDDYDSGLATLQSEDLTSVNKSRQQSSLADHSYQGKPASDIKGSMLSKDSSKVLTTKEATTQTEVDPFKQIKAQSMAIAERISKSLVDFAVTGDTACLLVTQRYLVAVQDDDGDNALHLAVIFGNVNSLRDLLRAVLTLPDRSVVNQTNIKQQTPLHLAVITNRPDMVQLLLSAGCNKLLLDRTGNTPVHVAARDGFDKCLKTLLTCQSSCNSCLEKPCSELDMRNYDGYTPLHLTVNNGHERCAEVVIQAMADVNVGDGKSGRTALHHAVSQKNSSLVGYLVLEASADINIADFDGNTALHLSSASHLYDITALLMAAGADPNAENFDKQLKFEDQNLQEFREKGENEGREKCGSVDSDETRLGYTPLELAEGDEKMLKLLKGEQLTFGKGSDEEDNIESYISGDKITQRMTRVEPVFPQDELRTLESGIGSLSLNQSSY